MVHYRLTPKIPPTPNLSDDATHHDMTAWNMHVHVWCHVWCNHSQTYSAAMTDTLCLLACMLSVTAPPEEGRVATVTFKLTHGSKQRLGNLDNTS